MHTPLTPYFDPDLLKSAFAGDVDVAAAAHRIGEKQHRWLQTLVDPSDDPTAADTPRVDRLISGASQFAGSELPAALLISHEHVDDPQVYLYTLLYGIEPFDNRQALFQYLRGRFESPGQPLPEFDAEHLEHPVFDSWMGAIVDVQIDAVDGFFQHLEALPTLRSAMTRLLQQTVEHPSSDVPFDIDWVWLQIAQQSVSADGEVATEVVDTCSLLDAALDTYAGKGLGPGQSFIFLDGNGQTLDAHWSRPYLQALTGLAGTLTASFERTVQGFWHESTPSSRRDIAIQALAESLRHALLDNKANGKLTSRQFGDLRALLPGRVIRNDQGNTRVSKLAALFAEQDPLKLVGLFTVEFVDQGNQQIWLFCAETGLSRFENRSALLQHVSTVSGRGFLFRHLSFNDQPLASWTGALDLSYESYEGELVSHMVDGVIGLQQRNLKFALAGTYLHRDQAQAMIDDALDVRRLFDPRLRVRNDSGRWRQSPRSFVPESKVAAAAGEPHDRSPSLATTLTPAVTPRAASVTPAIEQGDTWVSQLRIMDDDLQQVRTSRPGVEVCARRLLNKQLCVFADGRVDAGDIQMRLPVSKDDDPQVTMSLVSWLLERVSGARAVDLPVGTQMMVSSDVTAAAYFAAPKQRAIINRLIKRAHAQFPESYLRQAGQFQLGTVREGDRQTDPEALSCDIRTRQMRLQLAMERYRKKLEPDVLDMLQQLLDRPSQTLRSALGNQWVQVSNVSLEYAATQPAALLTNTFVFHRPANADGPLVFWSAIKGLRVYRSLAELARQLDRWLRRPGERPHWQELLSAQDALLTDAWLQTPGSPAISLQTRPIVEHFIHHLQRDEQHRRYLSVEAAFLFAKRRHLDSKGMVRLSRDTEQRDVASTTLDVFTLSLQSLLLGATLPDWLVNASSIDLSTYCELVKLYFKVENRGQNFLFGIPNLKDFARERLLGQLAVDFPGQWFEPDDIQVKHFRYVTPGVIGTNSPLGVPAATEVYEENLTDFVLNHLGADKSFSLSVSTTDPLNKVSVLTPPYLSELARKLDVGGSFQKILEDKLSPGSPDYARRLERFCWQFPVQMLEMAFEQKLEKVISDKAWWYIQRVVEMPDALARQPVDGVSVALRPFALIAAPGMEADRATGMYLFGADNSEHGPLVLHAIFHDEFCFREYADEAALMADLRSDTRLQTLVLQRVSPQARARYDFGGFGGAHLPGGILPPLELPASVPLPPTLSRESITGNANLFFFRDTLKAMKNLAKNQSVTTAQSDWASFTYLLTLAGEQVLTFLPGKLGVLVAAWQSQSWFKSSISSATTERWGKAVSEFTAGLAILLSQRNARAEEQAFQTLEEIKEEALEGTDENNSAEAPNFSWGNDALSADMKTRLRAFEINDVELQALQKDPLLNIYFDKRADKRYATVGGKVFQVRQIEGTWRVVGDPSRDNGPPLRLNAQQHWELDFKWGLLGGGPCLSRVKASAADANVEEVFITQARGMKDIRALNRDYARRIGQGHLQAKRYLENALDNLKFPDTSAALDPRIETIIKDFFGVTTVSDALRLSLQTSAKTLFDEVLDASLAPWSSSRYVAGINKPGYEQTLALTVKSDQKRRIFLTERFFEAPDYMLSTSAHANGFDAGAHHRATVLIHEISHLVLNTHDIAYVESPAPFVDLLQDSSLGAAILKAGITDIQQTYMSHLTPRDRLFQVLKDGLWRDLKDEDGEGMQTVLEKADAADLEEARDAFLNDEQVRWSVMLKNADSVALLMTLLGRTPLS